MALPINANGELVVFNDTVRMEACVEANRPLRGERADLGVPLLVDEDRPCPEVDPLEGAARRARRGENP
jgi:hypothetical protein